MYIPGTILLRTRKSDRLLAAGEDYEAIRRDDYGRRCSEAVHWRSSRKNAARIAGHGRTSVSIAVEHFLPMPGSREADGVIEPSLLRQRADDDHVITRIEPAMECNHSVIISLYKWTNVLSAQGRMIPAQLDDVLRELEELRRRRLVRLQTIPFRKVRRIRQYVPWLVLQELLAHE